MNVELIIGMWFISLIVFTFIMVKRRQRQDTKQQGAHARQQLEVAQLTWEPTAVSQYLEILVYVKRGKTSILMGKTDITAEDFDTQVENLTVLAEKRAMELNSMGIKWDGDVGTMVPSDVANRIAEDRDKNAKRVKELEGHIYNMTQPEGVGLVIREYLQRVSPNVDLGTLRLMNNGHVLVEIPPGDTPAIHKYPPPTWQTRPVDIKRMGQ